ncbi:MAG: hypothetical protein WBP13_05930 [Methylophilaceae bacterium]
MYKTRMRGYPKWFYQFLIMSFLLLCISGFLLIPNALMFRLEWDVTWIFPEEKRLWLVALHVLVGFISTLQLGALWSVHMRIGWRHHKNINSGIGMSLILLALILTGIGIYYLGETFSVSASVAHILIGVSLPFLFAFHIYAGRTHQKIH